MRIKFCFVLLWLLSGFMLPKPTLTQEKHVIANPLQRLPVPQLRVVDLSSWVKHWLSYPFFPIQTSMGYWAIVKPSGYLSLFNPYLRKELWSHHIGVRPTAAFSVGDHHLFLPTWQARLCAFLLKDGRSAWCSPLGALAFSPAQVAKDTVFVQANNDSIYAFSTSNGHIKWSKQFPQPQPVLAMYASPAVGSQYIWAVTRSGFLVAMDRNTGDVCWRHLLAAADISQSSPVGAVFNLSPVFSHGVIVASAYGSGIWAWDVKQLSHPLWHIPSSGLLALMAYGHEIIMLNSCGNLSIVSLRSGDLIWHKHFDVKLDLKPYRLAIVDHVLWVKGHSGIKRFVLKNIIHQDNKIAS